MTELANRISRWVRRHPFLRDQRGAFRCGICYCGRTIFLFDHVAIAVGCLCMTQVALDNGLIAERKRCGRIWSSHTTERLDDQVRRGCRRGRLVSNKRPWRRGAHAFRSERRRSQSSDGTTDYGTTTSVLVLRLASGHHLRARFWHINTVTSAALVRRQGS